MNEPGQSFINTKIGSRAGMDDSDCWVIRWRRNEVITAACVVIGFVALLFFTIGYVVARH